MEKKYSNIDDLFRDKFRDFELYPPDHIWDNIKQQIKSTDTGKSGKGISNGTIIGITIFLIVTSIFMFYLLQKKSGYYHENDNIKVLRSTDSDYHLSVPRSASISKHNSGKALQGNNKKTQFAQKDNDHHKQAEQYIATVEENIPKGNSSLLLALSPSEGIELTGGKTSDDIPFSENNNGSFSATDNNNFREGNPESFAYNTIGPALLNGRDIELYEESEKNHDETGLETESSEPVAPAAVIHSDYGKKGNWLFGLYFTPEVIFHSSADDFNNRCYSVDVNAIYLISGFTVQSGIGVGWSSDNGNYKIDYNQYLGSYDDVYDVTFDTIGDQIIPIYHTESVDVYDTLDHVYISPTKRHFTYLNVPLLIGYGNDVKRWSWNVKAGPMVSFLIHENNSDINLTDSQNKILNVEDEIPGRLKTSWQFAISAGVSYKLSNTISFGIEPLFKYYVNPIHDQSMHPTGNPYSIGLRAGLVLGF